MLQQRTLLVTSLHMQSRSMQSMQDISEEMPSQRVNSLLFFVSHEALACLGVLRNPAMAMSRCVSRLPDDPSCSP